MHQYANLKKTIAVSDPFWDTTAAAGLSGIVADGLGDGRHETAAGHRFTNMSSYSYLGLDTHPALVKAAAAAVERTGALNTSISRMRVRFPLLDEVEAALSDLWEAEAVTVSSAAAAAWAALPLLASGALTGGDPPLLVFDRHAHFCLNAMKAAAADETRLTTIAHNDIDALADLCRTHPNVAYIADGVYSTGGQAPVAELLELQERHGLFLFFDDAHGIATKGDRGRGVVLEAAPLNDRTIVIASLNKGFGAAGGVILLGPRGSTARRDLFLRNGGPLTWSQRINTAGLGAILASAELHRTPELRQLQRRLEDRTDLFDRLLPTAGAGDGLPIRYIDIGDETATVAIAEALLAEGFYASPIFFPIIARGRAGLRIMLRANHTEAEITEFAELLTSLIGTRGRLDH